MSCSCFKRKENGILWESDTLFSTIIKTYLYVKQNISRFFGSSKICFQAVAQMRKNKETNSSTFRSAVHKRSVPLPVEGVCHFHFVVRATTFTLMEVWQNISLDRSFSDAFVTVASPASQSWSGINEL